MIEQTTYEEVDYEEVEGEAIPERTKAMYLAEELIIKMGCLDEAIIHQESITKASEESSVSFGLRVKTLGALLQMKKEKDIEDEEDYELKHETLSNARKVNKR